VLILLRILSLEIDLRLFRHKAVKFCSAISSVNDRIYMCLLLREIDVSAKTVISCYYFAYICFEESLSYCVILPFSICPL